MGFANWLRNRMVHPYMRGLDVDDPQTTELRRTIIKTNGFLRQVYKSWYDMLLNQALEASGKILELGSGGGFLAELYPNIVTSEIFFCPFVQVILNGERLPFPSEHLSAIVMTNVLHHIPDVRKFFTEAARCLKPGGIIAMIEPWNTPWAAFVYQHLHTEPFDPYASTWKFPSSGPLSSANGALPWLVFKRDRTIFESEFPGIKIQAIQPIMPFRYLVSGGVSMRQLMPTWSYPIWRGIERLSMPWMDSLAMFTYIRLQTV